MQNEKFFYARQRFVSNERVLSVLRIVDLTNMTVKYAFCINNPKFDLFSKKEARTLLRKRIINDPVIIPLISGVLPMDTVISHLLVRNDLSSTMKNVLSDWWSNSCDLYNSYCATC